MFLDNFLSMFFGLTALTREKVEELTELLVEKGDMQREEARQVAARIIEKGKEEKDEYLSMMNQKMDNFKDKLITKEDLQRLESKIDELLKYHQQNQG